MFIAITKRYTKLLFQDRPGSYGSTARVFQKYRPGSRKLSSTKFNPTTKEPGSSWTTSKVLMLSGLTGASMYALGAWVRDYEPISGLSMKTTEPAPEYGTPKEMLKVSHFLFRQVALRLKPGILGR